MTRVLALALMCLTPYRQPVGPEEPRPATMDGRYTDGYSKYQLYRHRDRLLLIGDVYEASGLVKSDGTMLLYWRKVGDSSPRWTATYAQKDDGVWRGYQANTPDKVESLPQMAVALWRAP